MDFTLEDWEQLGLDQGALFWDTALDNYQNLFLLSECCSDSGVPVTVLLGDHLCYHPQVGVPASECLGISMAQPSRSQLAASACQQTLALSVDVSNPHLWSRGAIVGEPRDGGAIVGGAHGCCHTSHDAQDSTYNPGVSNLQVLVEWG